MGGRKQANEGRASRSSARSANRPTLNAGREIISQSSKSKPPAKASVPRANDLAELKAREPKNHVKGNFNHAAFEMKPKELKEEEKKF